MSALIYGIIMLILGGFLKYKKANSDWNYFYRLAASIAIFILLVLGAMIFITGIAITSF